jgi:hypothetical protein
VGTSGLLHSALESQLFWGVIGLILAAIAMTGKLSMGASALLLVIAWVFGCIGIYRIEEIRNWYVTIGLWFSLGAALAFLAAWLHPSVLEHAKVPQLQFDFSEAEIQIELDRWMTGKNKTPPVIFVGVKNPTSRTIENVSVRITSIRKLDEPKDPDYTRHLKTLVGLPLMIRDGGPLLPEGKLSHETAIHSKDTALFNVVLLEPPHPLLLHAIRGQVPKLANDRGSSWTPFPPMNLLPGHYRLQLRAQGKDTPPATLTIEFIQIPHERGVRLIPESLPLP